MAALFTALDIDEGKSEFESISNGSSTLDGSDDSKTPTGKAHAETHSATRDRSVENYVGKTAKLGFLPQVTHSFDKSILPFKLAAATSIRP